MSVLSVLGGFLVSLLITAPFVWALTTWMCYSVDSIKYELGKYTTAYRCVECDQVYRLPQWICEKCGHEHEGLYGGMSKEVGKWNCKLSNLTLTYWWEPKSDESNI